VSADARELRTLTATPNPSGAVEGVGSYYTTERKLDPVWLARRALEAEPYNTTAWAAVLTLGRRRQLQPDQLADLLDRLATLAGDHEPEVAYYALLDAFDYLPPEHERPFLEAAGRVLPPEQIYRAPELSANVILLAGDLLAAEKNFEKALHRYKAAIEVDPDYPPIVVRAVERALPLARQQGKVESFENACRLIFMRTRDPMFGKEIGRIVEEAGLTRRAINWYCWVYDWSNYNAPGRYDSLRSAIRLLMGLEQYYDAERWSRKLYDATTHPLDGRQLVQVLRAMERTKDAAQALQLVQENEHRRLQHVAEQAARRAAQVR
jgi:tetratricopeptide (TPR) repeat protein